MSRMQEYVEGFVSENSALRRKLQSKSEAVLILSKELDTCRTERDQFKLMAEQLQDQYSNLKKKAQDLGMSCASDYFKENTPFLRPGVTVAQLLEETCAQNKALCVQIEDLKQRLKDAHGDIKVLRVGYNQHRTGNPSSAGESQTFPDHHKEELVQQLETLNVKCSQLEADLQVVLDEKEDLVRERDVYKCKVHRLNHELSFMMKGGDHSIDIDSLIMENRYLQERLSQCQEEQEATRQSLQKYKGALDQRCKTGSVNMGTSAAAGLVVTQRQVRELLDAASSSSVPNTPVFMENLRSVCQALFDALEEKSLRLAHQKKANRILAKRVVELECLAESNGATLFPSQTLLGGYSVSHVDRDKDLLRDLQSTTALEESKLDTSDSFCQETSSASSSALSGIDSDDCKPLPMKVQALVVKALEELQLETIKSS